ncbi:unnamed protein product [Sphagnum balticum]
MRLGARLIDDAGRGLIVDFDINVMRLVVDPVRMNIMGCEQTLLAALFGGEPMGGVRIVLMDEGAVLVAACGVQDVEETAEAGLRWRLFDLEPRVQRKHCVGRRKESRGRRLIDKIAVVTCLILCHYAGANVGDFLDAVLPFLCHCAMCDRIFSSPRFRSAGLLRGLDRRPRANPQYGGIVHPFIVCATGQHCRRVWQVGAGREILISKVDDECGTMVRSKPYLCSCPAIGRSG